MCLLCSPSWFVLSQLAPPSRCKTAESRCTQYTTDDMNEFGQAVNALAFRLHEYGKQTLFMSFLFLWEIFRWRWNSVVMPKKARTTTGATFGCLTVFWQKVLACPWCWSIEPPSTDLCASSNVRKWRAKWNLNDFALLLRGERKEEEKNSDDSNHFLRYHSNILNCDISISVLRFRGINRTTPGSKWKYLLTDLNESWWRSYSVRCGFYQLKWSEIESLSVKLL